MPCIFNFIVYYKKVGIKMTKEIIKNIMENIFRQTLIDETEDTLIFAGYLYNHGNVIFYFNTETQLLEGIGGG
jgi:hypothetical protein